MNNGAPEPEKGFGAYYEMVQDSAGQATLALKGRLDETAYRSLLEGLGKDLERLPHPHIRIDLGQVTYLDDFGALILVEIHRRVLKGSGLCTIIRPARGAVAEVLSLLQIQALCDAPPLAHKKLPNPLVALGDAALKQARDLKYAVSFSGSVLLAVLYMVRRPGSLRGGDTLVAMRQVGVDALPIVGLISFLLGLILAFMSSVQLKQFGAGIYVASLVSLAMVRELGPIITAILVAGRSGSAFASEIGTMKISQEVDALFTMGFDPTRFLVVPKLLAALAMVPLLTIFADLFAIFGGLTVGVLLLDLTYGTYVSQTLDALKLDHVLWSLFKSGFFAANIVWISCLRGFQVRGGPSAVGAATTSAVVSGIFLVILWDSVFAVVQLYWN